MTRTHRLLLTAATAAMLPFAPAAAAAPPKVNSFYPANKEPLPPSAYSILPLGAVMPQGWLKQQLTIQAKGLTGNLPKFWKDLGPDNGWLGGKGESWERGPYYMDGMVPLAFLTQDPELLEMAKKWVGWTLDNPRPDGAIGPASCKDWWPLGLMCKTLTQYYDATGDARVIPVMTRFFAYMKAELPKRPLFEWAKMRWADTALSAIWLYNRTGDPELLEVSKLLMSQGYDYAQQFSNFEPYSKASPNWNFENHGVNAGMAYKTPGIMFQLTGEAKYKNAVYDGIRNLDKYHGRAGGTFAADECYAGTINVVTDYPFSDTIKMTVSTPKPVEFPLQLRIPAWAEGATISNGFENIPAQPGRFATLSRFWSNSETIILKLPMKIRIERRFHNSATVLRGPLVYALRIGENWQKFRGDDAHPDYEVLPTTPWNYGLILDEKNPEKSFKIVTKPMADPVYANKNAPVELHAKGRILPVWKEARNSADLLPVSPVKSTEPVQDIVLIPYGCAKLRITEFPVIDESDNSSAN